MGRRLSPLAAAALNRPANNSHPSAGRRSAPLYGLLALLLAAAVATLMVWADRMIDTWTDGHLFLAWVGLWLVIFAATALLDSWSRCRASTRPGAQPKLPAPAPATAGLQTDAATRRMAEMDGGRHSGSLPYL